MFGFFKKKSEPKELKAMVNGEVISVTEVKDDVFSSCMLGKGIAIHPTDGVVVAPVDGEISVTMEKACKQRNSFLSVFWGSDHACRLA